MTYNEEYTKRPEESELSYKYRLCKRKEADKLSWNDVSKIFKANTGIKLSGDAFRKWYDLHRDDDLEPQEIEELLTVTERSKVEKMKLSAERVQLNAILRRISREETIRSIGAKAAEKINETFKLPVVDKLPSGDADMCAILQISDWHYGIEILNPWNIFDTNVAKKRVAQLKNEVIDIIIKNNIKDLYVVELGDLISGRIHSQIRINNQVDVITQTIEVSELLAQFLSDLSEKCKLHCYFCSDNHSRVEPNLKEHLELEQLSRITPWYLKTRLQDNKNIDIITDTEYGDDIVTFNIWNYNIAAVHGHRDKPDSVIKNISLMTKTYYDVILTAHLHHFNAFEDNETMTVSNGCLMGVDDFAEKLRCSSHPSQNIIIVTKDNPVYCIYKVNLD